MNIFHHSSAFIEKHKKHHHLALATLALVIASAGVYTYRHDFAQAAQFGFVQSSWATGITANTATHASNQSGWTQYSATSTGNGVTATSNGVSLTPTTYTFTDDVATSSTPSSMSTGGGFNNGTNSSTQVSSGSVILTPPSFIATGGNTIRVGTSTGESDLTPAQGGDGYTYHKFTATTTSTFTVTYGSSNVEYLVVGGGGSGGYKGNKTSNGRTAGGGAGGFLSGQILNASGTYSISVGAGGLGVNNNTYRAATSSLLGSGVAIYATGGGKGDGLSSGIAQNGGSGGGNGGLGNIPATSPSQGFAGSSVCFWDDECGGGGAGAVGILGTGGIGREWPAGSGVFYAGGGGSLNSAGGVGGGGGFSLVDAANGTGGGGGGGRTTSSLIMPGGNGGSGIVIIRYLTPTVGSTSGTFTSAVIDTGAKSNFTTFGWSETLNGYAITMKARSSNSATMVGATDWGSCSNITKNADLSTGGCVTNGHRYVQYQAVLTGDGMGTNATLDSVNIGYTQYALSGDLTSSVYDTGDPTAVISGISWTTTGSGADETAALQVSTSADNSTWTSWSSSYTTSPVTLGTAARYFQYKILLTSSGDDTKTVTQVTTNYVINIPPVVTTATPVQVSDSASASYGKVTFTYDVSDTDTIGGATQNILTPTKYEYYDGSTWHDICTATCAALSSNAFNTIALSGNGVVATSPTIVWTATSTASVYSAGAKIRVTVSDGENANSTTVGTSGTFTLDSVLPVIAAKTIDSSGSQDVVTLTATDNSALSYRLCDTSDFAACTTWTSGLVSGAATPINWAATGAPAAETVYMQVRDLYGNVSATASVVAPATPGSFLSADVSNPSAQTFGEALSWTAPAGAVSYKVYYATTTLASDTPGAYYLLASPTTNVYAHTITTATTTAHWYKVAAVNSNGDISNYATLSGDVPDSYGTTLPDSTAPVISNIAVPSASIRNTSATITFTTDELAIAKVYYGTTNFGTACNSYGTPVNTTSYVTAQSVTLTGLTASTPYYYCLKAIDTLGNPTVLPSTGVDGSAVAPLTTAGGPTITVAPQPNPFNDTSATITWTTSTSSDSYVYYATSQSVSNPKTAGTATLVDCVSSVCQHSVGIANLTAGTKYYYYVKSTDGVGNTTPSAIDNFTTTIDNTPPVITDIATPVTSAGAVVIVWTTNEPATSQVLYGGTTGDRSKYTTTDTTKSIYHVVTLSSATTNSGVAGGTNDLTPSTPYYYVVTSADVNGNTATSDEQTVTTPSTGSVTIVAVSVVNRITNPETGATPDTTPPTISNIKVDGITPFGATVTFDTSEDADAFVEYGKDTLYGDSAGDKVYGTTHTIKLRGLTLGTEYHAKVTAHDKAGNTGTSDDQTFKTTFLSENLADMTNVANIEQFQKEIENAIESILPSLVPPFVSKPAVGDITESEATITFKTNIKSFPTVSYVEQGAYDETNPDTYTGEVSDIENKTTDHTLKLTGLKSNTKYHYQARAFSLPKVIGKSADLTFTTKAAKIVGSIVERKRDSFTVVWVTDEPTTSIVEFKNARTGITERKVDGAMKTSHSVKVENLPAGTTYAVDISGLNEQGNVVEAGTSISVTTSTDTTDPVISGFKVDNALVPGRTDRIQTIVSWITDEPSNGTVYYEEGTGAVGDTTELANKSEALDSYTVNHSIILANLKPGTIYRIKVVSADDSGNIGSFGPRTVITPRQTESITDIIFKNFEDSFKFLRKI